MPFDYKHFDSIDTPPTSEDEVDEGAPSAEGRVCTEEGLFRAFLAIHEHRLDVDQNASISPDSLDAASAYEDIASRLLLLDGVRREADMRSLGHRAEAAHARLGAAKVFLSAGRFEAAEEQAGLAVQALAVYCEPERAALAVPGARDGDQPVHVSAGPARLCRARARFRLGHFDGAREDALAAGPLFRGGGAEQQREACTELALMCEVALHGGGPGEGAGHRLSPEEANELEVHSVASLAGSLCSEDGAVLDVNTMD